jgi:hypothetical protein
MIDSPAERYVAEAATDGRTEWTGARTIAELVVLDDCGMGVKTYPTPS